jgi:DNA-binding CsgD family transcriptional regulator
MAHNGVSGADLDALRNVVAAVHDDCDEPLPASMFTDLARLIPSEEITFIRIDTERREMPLAQHLNGMIAGLDESSMTTAFWTHYWDCWSCSYPDRTGDLTSVTRLSDFYPGRSLYDIGMWTDYLRHAGLEREMMLCLPSRPGRTLRFLFWRGPGRDFSERDRTLLALLRPHLAERVRHWRRGREAQLTPRQLEIMRLVAAGHTNTQIGRRLSIAESTVRTHLEHVFDRLQVTSRTAAVRRVFDVDLADA